MSIEIILGLMLLCWLHGRLYPWSYDMSQRIAEQRRQEKLQKHIRRQEQARYDKENGSQV